jgi:hypothetical protein
MIGNVIIAKEFGRCIAYCLEDKKMKAFSDLIPIKKRAEVLLYNKCFGNKQELIEQFKDVRKLNPKQSNPVWHLIFSMADGERISQKLLIQLVLDCAQELGFTENQFLAVEHKDTAHQHIHIVVNRIGFSGKTTVSNSNDYRRVVYFCRKMEHKYSLEEVLSPKVFLPKEQRLIPRINKRKDNIKTILQQILSSAKSFDNFCDNVLAKRYKVVVKSQGIAFIDDKDVKVTGSDIGLSLLNIEKQIERNNREIKPKTTFIDLKERKRSLHL